MRKSNGSLIAKVLQKKTKKEDIYLIWYVCSIHLYSLRKGSCGIEIDKKQKQKTPHNETEYRAKNLTPFPPKCENLWQRQHYRTMKKELAILPQSVTGNEIPLSHHTQKSFPSELEA